MSKKIIALITSAIILLLTVVGVSFVFQKHALDYDRHLTADVYVDTAINQNVNLVFYKTGCPYCQAGKKAVVTTAKESAYPTFYIDVESDKGQQLVKQYQVEKAATIITLRNGESQLYLYARKTQAGKITANTKNIKEAFND
ncbi:thioredoxin family protein [Streptococcus sp.]|uniref:thioredoxin family protein n=1 Tax=Streptococcus sp. TaxID=1306 RepID=UPI00290A7825|nr:thioredoxin family protein [Streptococcus sp.]MDU6443436.1 thioredoxin family protein [Streptococcus sp.]MDU6639093.1 thioredoxin family protein [Streptococcus sp.]